MRLAAGVEQTASLSEFWIDCLLRGTDNAILVMLPGMDNTFVSWHRQCLTGWLVGWLVGNSFFAGSARLFSFSLHRFPHNLHSSVLICMVVSFCMTVNPPIKSDFNNSVKHNFTPAVKVIFVLLRWYISHTRNHENGSVPLL